MCSNINQINGKIIRLVMKNKYKVLSKPTMLLVLLLLPRYYPPTPEPVLGAYIGIICYQKAMLHLL